MVVYVSFCQTLRLDRQKLDQSIIWWVHSLNAEFMEQAATMWDPRQEWPSQLLVELPGEDINSLWKPHPEGLQGQMQCCCACLQAESRLAWRSLTLRPPWCAKSWVAMLTSCPAPNSFKHTQSQEAKLLGPHSKTETYRRCFIPSDIRPWNSIPPNFLE